MTLNVTKISVFRMAQAMLVPGGRFPLGGNFQQVPVVRASLRPSVSWVIAYFKTVTDVCESHKHDHDHHLLARSAILPPNFTFTKTHRGTPFNLLSSLFGKLQAEDKYTFSCNSMLFANF